MNDFPLKFRDDLHFISGAMFYAGQLYTTIGSF